MPSDSLEIEIRDRVLARMGFSEPPSTDLEGLRALYAAWCANVPFDNVRKMIAVRTSRPLPGLTATDFVEGWLAHGAGGTCWSSSNALFALAQSVGFDVKRAAGSMRDLGTVNHGSVRAYIDGCVWLIDSSMLTNVPLPLGDEVFISPDPVCAAEVEPVEGGGHRIWWTFPPRDDHFPCGMPAGEVTYASYVSWHEASREQSPFNQRLYARRNGPGKVLVLSGNMRYLKTAAGLDSQECTADELLSCLRDDMGLSEELVDHWARSGALADSLQPSTTPPPPPLTQVAPSRRA